ncbi:MAG TPA: hypothetical protein VNA16_00635 [Abditibacteriaceae bacterium]|nr:hypothetical protein [Abditibacteriaceae bacterium]
MKPGSLRPLHHSVILPWLAALVALAGGVLPRAARAADPVTMEIMSPLAQTEKPLILQVRMGRWFPVAVTLSNTGDAVQGTLTLRLTSTSGEDRPSSQFFTPVELGPNQARKRIWLYGRMEGAEYDGAEVQFSGRGFKTLRETCVLKPPDSAGTRIVLTISDTDERLSYLQGLRGPGLGLAKSLKDDEEAFGGGASAPGLMPTLVRPLGAAHEWVPDRWIGFDAVDTLVLHDFPHTALTTEQLTALRGYVAGGGCLIVLGGANGQRLAQSPLADLWPVAPGATGTATPAEVSTLINRYVDVPRLTGADRLGGAPILVGRSTLRPRARHLAGSLASPLLAGAAVGAGEVLFLAVDPTRPPFLGWSGNAGLWADMFKRATPPRRLESVATDAGAGPYGGPGGMGGMGAPPPGYGYPGQANAAASTPTGQLWTALSAARQLRTPPVSYIVWFLALYVFFLVPVNYCVLRYFDRRELAWITIPVIVVAFSVMSYAAALSIHGNAILLRHVAIVQGAADSGAARTDAMLWLFSPRKTTYNITSADPQMVVGDYATGDDSAYPRLALREPGVAAAFAADAPVNMWDSRVFVGHAVSDIGKGVRVQAGASHPSVQNNTGQDLRGVVVVMGGAVRGYGDVASGATASTPRATDGITTIDPTLVSRIQRAAGLEKIFPAVGEENLNAIAQQSLTATLGPDFGKMHSGNWLIAWSDQPPGAKDHPATALTIGEKVRLAHYVTLFIFRLPDGVGLTKSPGRGALKGTVPGIKREATVRLTGYESATSGPSGASGGPNSATAAATMTYDCALAAATGGAANVGQAKVGEAQPWRQLTVTAQGNRDPYGYQQPPRGVPPGWPGNSRPAVRVNPKKAPPPVQLQIWNFKRRQWQSLRGRLSDQSGAGAWTYQDVVPDAQTGECVQEPDNLVRIRVRTAHNSVRVNSLQVTATEAGARP